jgi:protein-L-isoaspartate(D-aspartate) O-methyltransferase
MEGIDLAVRILAFPQSQGRASAFWKSAPAAVSPPAIMARLTERVLTLDRYRTLVQHCAALSSKRPASAMSSIRQADGSNGHVGEGTFDRILVTAAFTGPAALLCRAARLRRHADRARDGQR